MFRFLHDDSGGGRGAGGDNKTAATNATSDKSTIAMMLTSALPKACETGCLLLLDDPLLDVWHRDVSCAYPEPGTGGGSKRGGSKAAGGGGGKAGRAVSMWKMAPAAELLVAAAARLNQNLRRVVSQQRDSMTWACAPLVCIL